MRGSVARLTDATDHLSSAGPQCRVQGHHAAAGRDHEDAERAFGNRVFSKPRQERKYEPDVILVFYKSLPPCPLSSSRYASGSVGEIIIQYGRLTHFQIAEAYRRHGITPTTRDLVVVKILVTPTASSSAAAASDTTAVVESDENAKAPLTAQDVEKHLQTHVQGTPVPFTDQALSELTDWGRVRKYYKLNGIGWLDGIKDEAAKNREMGMLVMGGMALRGYDHGTGTRKEDES
ncbi:hypothetical protein NUW58_g9879 [Xylaria curta]|uniref:Uncharacterized protein n=1 Tax=Xylaria curta TaxID=42375 RepID=A0ACC1MUA4_9PEZI|nr:hypothetical protein NUW58_g9879 [Xylaria curta]